MVLQEVYEVNSFKEAISKLTKRARKERMNIKSCSVHYSRDEGKAKVLAVLS